MTAELFGLGIVLIALVAVVTVRPKPPARGRPAGAWQTGRDNAHRWTDDHTTHPTAQHTDDTTDTNRGTP